MKSPNKTINPIDRHVGARIRMQRMVRSLSQTELGGKIGVTFQQVQKYEKGKNRVSASRLQQIANTLKVTPEFFFEETQTKAVGAPAKDQAIIDEFISSRDGAALCRAFSDISNPKIRRSIVSLVAALAQS